jgi:uncharacterized protein
MGRLLTLILLVVVAVWLVRRALRDHARRSASQGEPRDASSAPSSQDLVRCAHCGLLLPRAEARGAAGEIYCGEEHARLGPTSRGRGR